MYLADAKYLQGDIDSALVYINGTKELVDSVSYNSALIYATRIYLRAGLFDSAYTYAHELINRQDPTHRETAFSKILSPELRKYLQADTVEKYLDDYVSLLDGYYDANQNQLAINQQAMYNYKLHDVARQKAEKSKGRIQSWLVCAIVLILIASLIILYLKNRNQKNLLQLHIALETIDKLKNDIDSIDYKAEDSNLDVKVLREKLLANIGKLDGSTRIDVPISILQSQVYTTLQDYIYQKKGISDNNDIWTELETVVLSSSPNFKKYVLALSNGSISSSDYRTALLIKCNISPTNMSYLFHLTRTSINSRRTSLSKKLFGELMNPKLSDELIRSL